MKKSYKDSFVAWTSGGRLSIGNACIERIFHWTSEGLVCTEILDKVHNSVWTLKNAPASVEANVEYHCSIEDNAGLSSKHLMLTATRRYGDILIETRFIVYPGMPFISLERRGKGISLSQTSEAQQYSTSTGIETALDNCKMANCNVVEQIDNVPIGTEHVHLTSVRLHDRTDNNDCLLTEDKTLLYKYGRHTSRGNIFIFSSELENKALMLVKESPTHLYDMLSTCDSLIVDGSNEGRLLNCGQGSYDKDGWCWLYGSTVGAGDCDINALQSSFRQYYSCQCALPQLKSTFVMSNTWGDRSQDARMCEDFVLKEIAVAKRLGLDVLQLDDGWQKGTTANSKLKKGGVWSGYYATDPDFWSVHPQRFPNGLEPIVKKAGLAGIELGLWFSPDSSNDFENWNRDVETLLALHRKYGVRFFKLDGVNLTSKVAEANYLRLLTELERKANNSIVLNLDCTAQNRPGYLWKRQFGTIFVENRYTDFANYYPHCTLRNLWHLSHYIPARKLQFEFLNNKRNDMLYRQDCLRPSAFDLSYEFAAVMAANPLAWLELSGLDEKQVSDLGKMLALHCQVKQDIFNGDVQPIGQCPGGFSITGFQITCQDKQSGYLLLFRENAKNDSASLELGNEIPSNADVRLLCSNTLKRRLHISLSGRLCHWKCASKRTFAIYRYANFDNAR